ncbi:MAG TPA: hypothetical protein VJ842_19555 [Pyrinomonadaceae bacterium]|nr:hypothetical protein [Pyrinomonadaceae bacterium]
MFLKSRQRILCLFITLWIVMLCFAFLSRDVAYALISNARSVVRSALFKQTPAVSALAQADAPIQISSITINSNSSPLEPKLDYVLTNVSGKPINAYAVRHLVLHGGQRSEGVILSASVSNNSLLQGGQSDSGSLRNEVYLEPVESIQLVVDFVEFEDGVKWGADKFKSADRLSGQRAGAREESARLLKFINEKNVDVTVQIFATEGSEIVPPTGNSSEWREGFREGINFKRGQLKRVYSKEGWPGVVNELKRSLNAAERKQR